MKLFKAIAAGAVGTTFMTLFSYGSSMLRNKQFKEPEMLAHLIAGPEGPFRGDDLAKGWLVHYLTGSLFSLTYQQFLQGRYVKNPLLKGTLFGGLYGLAGALVWNMAFKMHPEPPKTDYPAYYSHLVLAHLVFGAFAFGLLEKNSSGNKKNYKYQKELTGNKGFGKKMIKKKELQD